MSGSNDREFDRTLETAWAASQPASRHLDEDTWRAFFEGHLDADGREAALDHVSGCARCAGVFKAARTAALAQVPSRARSDRRDLAPRWFLQGFAALAATMAIAAVAMVGLRQDDGQVQPVSIAPAIPAPSPAPARLRLEKPAVIVSGEQLLATRGSRDNTAYMESLAAALGPYQRDEFGEAARRLREVAQSRPEAFEPAFYLGVALLLDGRPQEAVPVLERALTLTGPARREEATRWLTLARTAAAPQ